MKVQNPLTGRSSGSFAGAIFSTWKGKNVVRSKPIEVKPSNTLAQIKNRNRLKATAEASKGCRIIIDKTFKPEAVGKTEQNVFVSKNLQNVNIDPNTGEILGWSNTPVFALNTLVLNGLGIIDIEATGDDLTVTFNRALTAEEAASLELFVAGFRTGGRTVGAGQVPLTASNTATVTSAILGSLTSFNGVLFSPASEESYQSLEF